MIHTDCVRQDTAWRARTSGNHLRLNLGDMEGAGHMISQPIDDIVGYVFVAVSGLNQIVLEAIVATNETQKLRGRFESAQALFQGFILIFNIKRTLHFLN